MPTTITKIRTVLIITIILRSCCGGVHLAWLILWRFVALLYRCTSSIKQCRYIQHASVSEHLFYCCTDVYLVWLNLWKLVALLYRCTSNMTQSLETCCTVLQVYVACLRVLCGTRRAKRADTCRVLQQVADACGGANTEWMHVSIGELLSGANCTSSN